MPKPQIPFPFFSLILTILSVLSFFFSCATTQDVIHYNRGVVYSEKGQNDQAISEYSRAIDINPRLPHPYYNRGVVYRIKGKYGQALSDYTKALEISRRINDPLIETRCLNAIGIVYEKLGQYQEALNYHKQSLEISRRIGDMEEQGYSLANIGYVYLKLGQYQEGLSYFKQSLEISRGVGDTEGEVGSLNNIGWTYLRLGQYQQALSYSRQALEINRRIGDVKGEANSLNNIGFGYNGLGQYQEALSYFKQSLEISRGVGDTEGEAISLNNIGWTYLSLRQYQEAPNHFKQSIKISESHGQLEGLWKANRGLGKALWKSGKPEEAVSYYKKAIDTIEELYRHTTSLKEEERSSMMGEKRFVYQEFIELLLELHRQSPGKGYDREAFLVSERSKSRTFQELMAKAGARIVFSGDETFKKMVEREQRLISELTNLRNLMAMELSKPEKERNQEGITSLKSQTSKAEASLTAIEKEIEARYPRYADLKRPKPLTVEELQGILKPDETLVSYAVGEEKTAAFVTRKGRFKLIEMAIGREELSKGVARFRRGVEKIETLGDLAKFEPWAAYELYRKIFWPVSSEVKGVTKLYLSADDVLYTLPFEALVDSEAELRAFEGALRKGRTKEKAYFSEYGMLHYLIDTYAITYLPSASVLRSLRKYEKPGYGKWERSLIAFADPIFSEEEDKTRGKMGVKRRGISRETELSLQLLTRSLGDRKLPRLAESAQEAEAIAREVRGREEDIYFREKASEENVYQTKLEKARYLLFSTHGLLGGDFPGVSEPSLVLTLVDNPPGRDGFLTMSEVLGLDLNAELVILSACRTWGEEEKAGRGEGFAGLTRSFMYAGGRSLFVTHWSVESQAARDLMVSTMKLMRGRARSEALREAKLAMKGSVRRIATEGLETRDIRIVGRPSPKKPIKGELELSLSHPYFWAPFVLVGEGK